MPRRGAVVQLLQFRRQARPCPAERALCYNELTVSPVRGLRSMDSVSAQPTRLLTVLAQDPSVLVKGRVLTVQVPVPRESLAPGPKGHRVHVIDFDATENRFYPPRAGGLTNDPYANVTDPAKLVADRHFHAQNVYALVATTLLQFESALGRHVSWTFASGCHHIKVAPHAFAEANAYYSRRDEGIVFG